MPVNGGLTVGVDVGATKVATVLLDPDGRVLHADRRPTDASAGPAHVLETIARSVRSLGAPASEPAAAVGVGVAAQVDSAGNVRFAPNLRWKDLPLGRDLSAALGAPVRVLNDVRAATVGEWTHGAARGQTDVVCLFLGTGLGGGVVSGGRLLTGATNTAGELGHLTIVHGGRRCTCPNSGCLEAYVGGWAIAERAREQARSDAAAEARLASAAGGSLDTLTARTVLRLAVEGDPMARRLLDETRGYLTAGLVGIVNAFNPSLLVAGGGVLDGAPDLFESALEAARPRVLPSAGEGLRGARAALGESAVAIGAAVWARGELA
jgi:glucokinase